MNRERLPAITIMQPWASLIMAGFKRGEFRSWAAPKRFRHCRLALHASASRLPKRDLKILRDQYETTSAFPFVEAALRRVLPTGAVLGVVRITGIAPATKYEKEMDLMMGILGTGFLWELEVIERFKNPVSARGSLGFWKWTYNPLYRAAKQEALL